MPLLIDQKPALLDGDVARASSAVNASWSRRLASRYLTIASAVSSEAAETSRSISSWFGPGRDVPLPATVNPSMFCVRPAPGAIRPRRTGHAAGSAERPASQDDAGDSRSIHHSRLLLSGRGFVSRGDPRPRPTGADRPRSCDWRRPGASRSVRSRSPPADAQVLAAEDPPHVAAAGIDLEDAAGRQLPEAVRPHQDAAVHAAAGNARRPRERSRSGGPARSARRRRR